LNTSSNLLACFIVIAKNIVFPGSVPLGSLIHSSMNSCTINAFVPLFVTFFSKSVPAKLISSGSFPSASNFCCSLRGMLSFLMPSFWNLVLILSTSKSQRYGGLLFIASSYEYAYVGIPSSQSNRLKVLCSTASLGVAVNPISRASK